MWQKVKSFFNDQWQQISYKQRYFIVGLILLLILTPVLVFALDAVTTAILKILTGIISLLVSFFGKLLAVVLHVLIYVAQYNNFIREQVVVEGWKVIRDVCNMFFVLGLLIIAFGTVLRLQNYQAKSLLRSFILGAIFVNFSKTICGLILDFAQIIMLTFVNGFKDVGAGNLTEMLGLTALFDVVVNNADASAEPLEGLGIFISYLLALVYIIVALVVILTMTIMLIQRAVMLWIYIILSPFPYLLSALPKAGKLGQAGSRWWSDFTGLVITGPMLAFFIWLSFFTASGSGMSSTSSDSNGISLAGTSSAAVSPNSAANLTNDINAGVTESGTAQAIIKFLVSIGLLWGGMMLTKETSSLLGNVVGAGMSNLKNAGNKVKKTAAGMATGAAKNTAKWAGRNALKGGGAVVAGLARNDNTKFGQAARKIGLAGKAWGEDLTENRQKQKTKKREETLKKLGLGEKSMKAFKEVADDDLVKGVGKTVKGAGSVALGVAGLATGNPLLMAAGLAGVGFGVKQSPFGRPLGRSVKKAIGGSKTMAYEKAYNDYNGKVASAASAMGSKRDQAKKDLDAGIIDGSEHAKLEQKAISDYKKAKEAARQELIVNQKIIANPNITADIKNPEQTRQSKINQANQEYAAGLEPLEKIKKEKLETEETIRDQKKDENKRRYAAGSITKDKLEQLNLQADINFDDRKKKINEEHETDSQPLAAQRDQKIAEAEKEYTSNKQVQADVLDLQDVTDPLARLFAKLEGPGIVSNLATDAMNYHPLQTTFDALKNGLKDSENATNNVKDISKTSDAQTLADSLSQKMFSGGLKGLDSSQIKFYQSLVDNQNKNSQPAIDNLAAAIRKLDSTDKANNNILNSLIRGISTFSKSGGDSAGRLKPLIDALNKQTDGGYDSFQPKAQSVKLREVDQTLIAGLGNGQLQIDSFARQQSIVNIIGVDFDSLNYFNNIVPQNPTNEIVGANIEPNMISAVAQELNNLINKELESLQQSGELDRINLLQLAQNRLNNPATLNNLSLRNTGIILINTLENYITSLHEALHGFGLINEQLVENVAEQMANIFCSIDASADVAKYLINIASQQKIDQQDLSANDIAQALKNIKPMNQVEKIIAKEIDENY